MSRSPSLPPRHASPPPHYDKHASTEEREGGGRASLVSTAALLFLYVFVVSSSAAWLGGGSEALRLAATPAAVALRSRSPARMALVTPQTVRSAGKVFRALVAEAGEEEGGERAQGGALMLPPLP